MGFRSRWTTKSGRAKAITILAVLLILQVGLCFGTPRLADWSNAELRFPSDPMDVVTWMLGQLMLGGVTAALLISALIGWFPPARKSTHKKDPP